MPNVDESLAALREIQSEFARFGALVDRVTEADTRVKLIDRLLKEVCGWPESAIQREEHNHQGYTDYILSLPTRRALVVEAKREGITFEVPKTTTQRSFRLDGSLLTDAAIKEAVLQARSYADELGIRYSVASNGAAWIIFRAIRDDMPWRQGKARVFPTLDYIADHFTDFWNLLSYESVSSGSLESEFGVARSGTRLLLRVVDKLFNADLPLQRNRLHAQLEPLIRRIFSEIADQDTIEVLQSCYVHTASLKVVATDLDCVITDSIPAFLARQGTEDIRPGEDAGRFGEIISRATHENSGELLLLLGGIGSGKTTFLKRYERTVGRDLLDRRTLWFHVDFLRTPIDPLQLELFVWDEILTQLRARYRSPHLETRRNIKRVFADDIQALKETVLRQTTEGSAEFENDLGPYLERWRQRLENYVPGLLKVAREKRDLAIVLFIDNVDQLAPSYQAQVFLVAQRITRIVESVTVISMREESYYAASVQKTFTAYSNRKFHIASPRFRVLVGSRIRYALDVLQRTDEEVQIILPSGIEMDRGAIADFLTIVQTSIFEHNRNIARFIEAICFGNMRLALQMFTTFLASGATDVDKMLSIYRREGAYHVAYHEFVKSIMLGDRQYYREEQSPIMNLFDCGAQRNASHFTALRAIEILKARRGEGTAEGQGYVPIAELMAVFEDTFDNLEDCLRVLNRLVSRQLIEANTRSIVSIEGANHVRLTSAGWYYQRYLARAFSYLDLILQDTPFDDPNVEHVLRNAVFTVGNLSDREDQKVERMEVRFDRVEKFLEYLAIQESKERDQFKLARSTGVFASPIVAPIQREFEKQREWIRRRLLENRERFADETFGTEADAEVDDEAITDEFPLELRTPTDSGE